MMAWYSRLGALFGNKDQCASICSFQRTSEIQFPLLERVEVGKGVVDEVCREPHFGVLVFLLYLLLVLFGPWNFVLGGRYAKSLIRVGRGSKRFCRRWYRSYRCCRGFECESKFAISGSSSRSTRLRWENKVGQLLCDPNPNNSWGMLNMACVPVSVLLITV